jgi:dipeptidase D
VHDAPHVPVLLETFRHYTGIADAGPISIGGGTHARMLPHGVNFGPAMPGELYTGHSEHEFITREQFLKNLEMYTSLLVDLSVK